MTHGWHDMPNMTLADFYCRWIRLIFQEWVRIRHGWQDEWVKPEWLEHEWVEFALNELRTNELVCKWFVLYHLKTFGFKAHDTFWNAKIRTVYKCIIV